MRFGGERSSMANRPQSREDARSGLKSDDPRDRRQAARYLIQNPSREVHSELQQALARESDFWSRTAIEKALRAVQELDGQVSDLDHTELDEAPSKALEEAYARALQETAERFLHEIKPIVGVLKVYAAKEVPNYGRSRTSREIQRLSQFLRAIGTLCQAASPPKLEELDLAGLVKKVATQESQDSEVRVQTSGLSPMQIVSDSTMLEIAVANGLRNAIEATEACEEQGEEATVTVVWGMDDRDAWITILDRRIGLPLGIDRVFGIGVSNKEGHLGMGLANAKRAIESLAGEVSVSPRQDGGTRLGFRWPLTA